MITTALKNTLNCGIVMSLTFLLLLRLQNLFSLLFFHMNFSIICMNLRSILGILIGVTLNLQIAFSIVGILLVLIRPTHELERFLSLLFPLMLCNFHCRDLSHPCLNIF